MLQKPVTFEIKILYTNSANAYLLHETHIQYAISVLFNLSDILK